MPRRLVYRGTGDWRGETLCTLNRNAGGTYTVSRWLPSSTATPRRTVVADLDAAKVEMKRDGRAGRLVWVGP